MRLPEEIKAIIGGRCYEADGIGMSGSDVLIFEDMVLKIRPASEETGREGEMLRWRVFDGAIYPGSEQDMFFRELGAGRIVLSQGPGSQCSRGLRFWWVL